MLGLCRRRRHGGVHLRCAYCRDNDGGDKHKRQGNAEKIKAYHKSFQGKCGALICRDLKGLETGEMLCSCEDCVRNAVLAYEEAFKE